MKEKINVLVTGASGTVGFEVLKQLCRQPDRYRVYIIARDTQKNHRLFRKFKDRIEIIYADITDETCMKDICSGKQVVIHLAAIIPPLADEQPEMAYRVNTLGTQYLVKGMEQYAPDAFLVYSSTIAVYGDRLQAPYIKVGDELRVSEGDIYAQTKTAAEEIIRASTINWCILRLTAIMGKHKMSKLMFHVPLETCMEICTPSDTARALVNAIDKKEALSGRIFNLAGGEQMRLSYKELLTRSFAAFGLGPVDFPEKSFAEKNFHCGYYADGDELEELLHFRRATLESYFGELHRSVSPLTRWLASMFKKPVKRLLLKQSEPLQAVLKNDKVQLQRFF